MKAVFVAHKTPAPCQQKTLERRLRFTLKSLLCSSLPPHSADHPPPPIRSTGPAGCCRVSSSRAAPSRPVLRGSCFGVRVAHFNPGTSIDYLCLSSLLWKNDANYTFLIGFLWKLSELMFIKCLEKYLASRKCLKHFRCYPPIVIVSIQTKNGFVP